MILLSKQQNQQIYTVQIFFKTLNLEAETTKVVLEEQSEKKQLKNVFVVVVVFLPLLHITLFSLLF